jgi:CHAD domain-containing protein
VADHRERERSYEPGPDADLPDLTRLPSVDRCGGPRRATLEATYFDTTDHVLLRAGVTLRRRTGGEDAGWHLKVPAEDGRDELTLPLARARHRPPRPFRDAVLGWTRDDTLTAVAHLVTHRCDLDLLDPDGAVLARVSDDRVEGERLDRSDLEPVAWREWEVELVDGPPSLLTAADELLAESGVGPCAAQVKLERVLPPPVPARPPLPRARKRGPARVVLHLRLAALVAELGRRDSQVRRGEPEGVHKARVTCRRLRGALATYRPLLDRAVTDPLRDELRWVAHSLGDVRDLDVVHDRLTDLLAEQPADLVLGPVRRRLDRTHAARRAELLAAARAALTSERYFVLRVQLDRLVAAPPWSPRAEEDARDVLRPRVRREFRRLCRRLEVALTTDDPRVHDEAVHEARRAAKRLRYAAEALEPVWGEDASALARAATEITSTLGIRQDTVVSRAQLLALAGAARAAGEDTFTYGRLHALEERSAADLDDGVEELWARVSDPGLRSWL